MGTQVAIEFTSSVEVCDYREIPGQWDAYVRAHPKGSVLHLTGMLNAYAHTNKNRSFGCAAMVDGKIVAILSAVRVSTLDGIASLVASRSIQYAEPLCDPTENGKRGLKHILTLHDNQQRQATLFAEIRNQYPPTDEREVLEQAGYEFLDYLNYVVDTTPSSDQLFQRLSKSTRNKIRRSFRRGVTIDSESSSAKIDRAYRLIQFSYERSSVPLVDVDLFHQAFDRLGSGTVKVRVATYNNEDVAGGISLTFGDRMLAWYGGTARVSGITSFDCLTWDEITWCSENGISKYDFGGAGWPDEEYGPREFKAKFGGELVRYGRYQKAFQPLRLKLATSAYRLMQRIKPR